MGQRGGKKIAEELYNRLEFGGRKIWWLSRYTED
jgi:hypothetical protein